jgi:hypothetical protein
VVIKTESLVFDAEDFGTEGVNAGIGGGCICAVEGGNRFRIAERKRVKPTSYPT